ncbi:hypothetical protein Gbth_005_058 [Gluconobacter thailandicus F149-1 = NBRC 100600]|uniref:DUF2125 domain-containing protein n=1 Tax=Gluconobacter thailandicus NBRC 3257 TaxID=1381097 RepID=A0ABQ0IT43_GLUTH|nr:DUF2125 domain-containing protein [Gluconobacter thailandicus]GAD25388.1 hypothetical protein NBRC3257_0387 [Gluconobacter thailandicus NBRC 3257]GAN92057.1 hypothetical protein Gbth_005_058 [Gluconobacter thailandicus F149-1 = NBRC 100600]GBR60538.1 hypothetical protein AA100600_2077 [Gluconobacter thailandicus F149-1 = NBRC 100600]GEL86036.1 hypothetical protein GTH01_03940 [Gluconobacter thailandicus F149-1 = NBRC 100600]
MTFSLNTVRYLKTGLVMAGIVTGLLFVDTLLWWRTTHTIETGIEARRAELQAAGWATTVEQITHGGWPFGAWVTLAFPHLRHDRSISAPFEAGWSGKALRVGGSWLELIRTGFPVFLPGPHAARFISQTVQMTILSQNLHLRFSTDHETTFKAPSAQIALTTPSLDQSISVTEFSGRLFTAPDAPHDATRLGLELSARTLRSPALDPLKLALRDARLVAALTSSTRKDVTPFFSLEGYDRLLLQTAAVSFGPDHHASRLSSSGMLELPAFTGHLTFSLLNWHDAAEQLLNTTSVRTSLAPDLQAILERVLHAEPSPALRNDLPLVFDVPVIQGQFPLSLDAFLQNISTHKIDGSHSRE